jgi:hypothetical protein
MPSPVPAASLSDRRLDAAEMERYDEDGYLVRTGVFEAAELAAITAVCEALVAGLVTRRSARRRAFGSYTFERPASSPRS